MSSIELDLGCRLLDFSGRIARWMNSPHELAFAAGQPDAGEDEKSLGGQFADEFKWVARDLQAAATVADNSAIADGLESRFRNAVDYLRDELTPLALDSLDPSISRTILVTPLNEIPAIAPAEELDGDPVFGLSDWLADVAERLPPQSVDVLVSAQGQAKPVGESRPKPSNVKTKKRWTVSEIQKNCALALASNDSETVKNYLFIAGNRLAKSIGCNVKTLRLTEFWLNRPDEQKKWRRENSTDLRPKSRGSQ